MSEPIRLLYAEDNAQDADLTRSHLEREAADLHLDVVTTGARCLERLAAESFDLLLLDNHLPDMEGLDVLARLRADGHTLPVVMVTGVGDDETVARALRAGADDYVPKAADYLVTLPGILHGIVARDRRREGTGGNAAHRVRRILYVEPNAMDAELTVQHFATAAPHLTLRVVRSSLDALTLLAPGHAFDLVLTDLRVPGMNALEFLREAHHRGIEVPFIVITGRGDEATAVAILRLGASDYLVKRENYLTQLPHAIDHALRRSELDQTSHRLQAELEALNASLEQKVIARTAELEQAVATRERAERDVRQLLGDADRSRRALLGVLEDERGTAEALRQNETLLRFVTNNAQVGLVAVDQERRCVFANQTYAELVGRSTADIVGRRVPDVVADGYEAQIRPELDRAFAGERVSSEMHRSTPEGERHYAATYEPVTTGDSVSRVVVVVVDITERKRAEHTVEESREQLRQLAGSLLTAREEERAAIARDLHDELGQMLSALKMDVVRLGRHVSDPEGRLRLKLADMSELANTAIRRVQQLATEFRPGILDDLGLAAAVEWSAGEFSRRSGVPCACSLCDTRLDLSRQTSIALYRIVQECLTNIGRHARATQVRVALAEINGHLILEVADNGRGITEDDLRRPRSIGLAGMRERAGLVGGTCAISGEPGKGTTVRVSVPLDAARGLP